MALRSKASSGHFIRREEAERNAFRAEEYWVFKALLAADTPPSFQTELRQRAKEKNLMDELGLSAPDAAPAQNGKEDDEDNE